MTVPESPTVFARIGAFALFLALTAISTGWFVWAGYNILSQVWSAPEVIYFDKGSLYMLGVGIGSATLTFVVYYEGILRRNLTKQITKVLTGSALTGVAVMFLFPALVYYPANQYLAEKGYRVCDKVSYQWLFYRKLVYTNNQLACEALVKEKEQARTSRGY